MMPDVSTIGNGTIGTNMIFANNSALSNQNQKRSIELLDDDWASPGPDSGANGGNGLSGGEEKPGSEGAATSGSPDKGGGNGSVRPGTGRQSKRAKNVK